MPPWTPSEQSSFVARRGRFWNCVSLLAFSSLAVSSVVVLSLALHAAEPPTQGNRANEDVPRPKTAAERWRRLKEMYPDAKSSRPAQLKPDQDGEAPTTASGGTAVDSLESRPVPSSAEIPVPRKRHLRAIDIATESKDGDRPYPQSGRLTDNKTDAKATLDSSGLVPDPLALPILPIDEEPAWILPAPTEAAAEALALPRSDAGHIVPRPAAPRIAFQQQDDLNEPDTKTKGDDPNKDDTDSPRGPNNEVRNKEVPTKVEFRKMSEINPFYDRDLHRDIREFSAKKTSDAQVSLANATLSERAFPPLVANWEAPNFFHYPLYFEDPALERYGHTKPPLVQPFASIGRFGTQLIGLPYQMTINGPCCEVYSLGWYRPGECAPKLKYPFPWNAKAAAVQAATMTGLVFMVP